MANLINCSTILYNKTISDNMNKITKLKDKLKMYEPIRVEFTNRLELDTLIDNEFKEINKELLKWAQYEIATYNTLGFSIHYHLDPIQNFIEKALNIITKNTNKEWTQYISWNIITGIISFLHGLQSTGLIFQIFLEITPDKLANLIYHNITYQLQDILLEDIGIFTCKQCSKKVNEINTSDLCIECSDDY